MLFITLLAWAVPTAMPTCPYFHGKVPVSGKFQDKQVLSMKNIPCNLQLTSWCNKPHLQGVKVWLQAFTPWSFTLITPDPQSTHWGSGGYLPTCGAGLLIYIYIDIHPLWARNTQICMQFLDLYSPNTFKISNKQVFCVNFMIFYLLVSVENILKANPSNR